jgi:DNA (cytosine-5)-methyltransferase 1
MLRIIREVKPSWIVGENVLGIVNWNGGLVFHEVQTDLEAEGYEVQPYVLPAVSVNAPHRRDRVWFIAYRNDEKCYRRGGSSERTWQEAEHRGNGVFSTASRFGEIGSTPNPSSNGCNDKPPTTNNIIGQDNIESGTQRERTIEGLSNEWDAADTGHTGLQGRKVNGSIGGSRTESDKLTSRCVRSTWQNFPTQSPICTGNDEFSSRLDGITFSKWRNESIKAAGNAVVPQVVLQIFKAIEAYNKL